MNKKIANVPQLVVDTTTEYKIKDAEQKHPYSLAIISNLATSISNFRGPLIREMVGRNVIICALAQYYGDTICAAGASLGRGIADCA